MEKELFEMLTSTMWQDYKGYKRDLNLKNPLGMFLEGLMFFVLGIGFSIGCIASNNDVGILLIFTIPFTLYGIYLLYGSSQYFIELDKVNRVAYDIELSSTSAKIIRTKKYKYGIVCDCENSIGVYLRLILYPKYVSIERTDNNCFIIAKNGTFSKKVLYGIYNSEKRKITVPIRFEKISRPNSNADLYIAEINGHTEKFNSFGDRIVR